MSWLKTWRERKRCFHHSPHDGKTWLKSHLIDTGMRKLWWCDECGRTWIR